MADPTPLEQLQPCLLDRLTDDEPAKGEESRLQRVVSNQKYRRGVLRDLEWLFNTQACFSVEKMPPELRNLMKNPPQFNLKDYPEAYRSVINYGTRQLCGLSTLDMQQLQEELGEAIKFFEPRVTARGLTIHANAERNLVTFEVEGELWANPLPEHLHLKTTVDLETGQRFLGDSPHG